MSVTLLRPTFGHDSDVIARLTARTAQIEAEALCQGGSGTMGVTWTGAGLVGSTHEGASNPCSQGVPFGVSVEATIGQPLVLTVVTDPGVGWAVAVGGKPGH
jgi:hypothetical protein